MWQSFIIKNCTKSITSTLQLFKACRNSCRFPKKKTAIFLNEATSAQFHIEYHQFSIKTPCRIAALNVCHYKIWRVTSTYTSSQAICWQWRYSEHRGGVLLWVTIYRPHLLVFNAQPQTTRSLQLQVWYFLNRPCIFNISNNCLKIHITILWTKLGINTFNL